MFTNSPPKETRVTATVTGPEGDVEMGEYAGFRQLNLGQPILQLELPPASGSFEDGPYQTILQINGEVYAILNFSVGASS